MNFQNENMNPKRNIASFKAKKSNINISIILDNKNDRKSDKCYSLQKSPLELTLQN